LSVEVIIFFSLSSRDYNYVNHLYTAHSTSKVIIYRGFCSKLSAIAETSPIIFVYWK